MGKKIKIMAASNEINNKSSSSNIIKSMISYYESMESKSRLTSMTVIKQSYQNLKVDSLKKMTVSSSVSQLGFGSSWKSLTQMSYQLEITLCSQRCVNSQKVRTFSHAMSQIITKIWSKTHQFCSENCKSLNFLWISLYFSIIGTKKTPMRNFSCRNIGF